MLGPSTPPQQSQPMQTGPKPSVSGVVGQAVNAAAPELIRQGLSQLAGPATSAATGGGAAAASTGAASAAQGAAAPGIGANIAAAAPYLLALANAYTVGKGIHESTKSGKSGDQVWRDKLRQKLQEVGVSDQNYQMYGYDVGREGDALQIDPNNQVASEAKRMLAPLSEVMSEQGSSKRVNSGSNLLANAVSNGADLATAQSRIKDIYQKMGVNEGNLQALLQQMHEQARGKYNRGMLALNPVQEARQREKFKSLGYGITQGEADGYQQTVKSLGGSKSELAPMQSPRPTVGSSAQSQSGAGFQPLGDDSYYWNLIKNGSASYKDLASRGLVRVENRNRSKN